MAVAESVFSTSNPWLQLSMPIGAPKRHRQCAPRRGRAVFLLSGPPPKTALAWLRRPPVLGRLSSRPRGGAALGGCAGKESGPCSSCTGRPRQNPCKRNRTEEAANAHTDNH